MSTRKLRSLKPPKFKAVGARIAQRLIDLGFVNDEGEADVPRFSRERTWDKTLLYYWVKGERRPTKDIERLASQLGRTKGWLLFGDEQAPTAKRAGE